MSVYIYSKQFHDKFDHLRSCAVLIKQTDALTYKMHPLARRNDRDQSISYVLVGKNQYLINTTYLTFSHTVEPLYNNIQGG